MRRTRVKAMLLLLVWQIPTALFSESSHELRQEMEAILSQPKIEVRSVDFDGEELQVAECPLINHRDPDSDRVSLVQIGWLDHRPLFFEMHESAVPMDDLKGTFVEALGSPDLTSVPESFSFCSGDLVCAEHNRNPQGSACRILFCSETDLVKSLGAALERRAFSKSDDENCYTVDSNTPFRIYESEHQTVVKYRIGAINELPLFINVQASDKSVSVIERTLLDPAILGSRTVIQRCPDGTTKVCVEYDQNERCLRYDCS